MLGQHPNLASRRGRGRGRSADAPTVIPYDIAATFRITGRPGNLVQDVVNISTDGVFVATAIGYGFEEERERQLPEEFIRRNAGKQLPAGDVTIGQLPVTALVEGFRLDPSFAHWVFPQAALDAGTDVFIGDTDAPETVPGERVFGDLLQILKAPQELTFLFSLLDSATGREFQDQPAHNLAALGKSNGERPFRLLAQPFHFAPRTTLRLQITERTEGVQGTLFIVLYGYRLVGAGACPEPIARTLHASPLGPVETIGSPDARVIPFDYVSRLQLTGRRGNQLEDEIPINSDGGFVATSIGYGLAAEERSVRPQLRMLSKIKTDSLRTELAKWKPGDTVDLSFLPLRYLSSSALLDGLRIKPGWIRIAFDDNGRLASKLPFELLDVLFERLNRPEDVSFRYGFFDTGTGRELQNQRIHNIAGLGAADGDRPFKRLARPMMLLPRSTIRVEIEEVSGRGAVFIAFQGYKLLDRARRSA